MNIIKVDNLNEYIQHTKDYEIAGWWFRGQPCASFRLLPSLFRIKKKTNTDDEKSAIVKKILPDDRTAIYNLQRYYNLNKNKKFTFAQTMFRAQHKGLPTRLLDFSADKFCALYFAINNPNIKNMHDKFYEKEFDEEFDTKYVAIYCINPKIINLNTQLKSDIFRIKDLDVDLIYKNDLPIAIEPYSTEKRIKAQKGNFVLFCSLQHPLDYYDKLRENMRKILIPKNNCKNIFEVIRKMGYSHIDIFPDEEGKLKEIQKDMLDNYAIY